MNEFYLQNKSDEFSEKKKKPKNIHQHLKVCTWATKVKRVVCSLLKISRLPAQQADSSGGLTISFQSENISR